MGHRNIRRIRAMLTQSSYGLRRNGNADVVQSEIMLGDLFKDA